MLMTPYGWAPYLLQAGTLTIRCAFFLCGFTETKHINRVCMIRQNGKPSLPLFNEDLGTSKRCNVYEKGDIDYFHLTRI